MGVVIHGNVPQRKLKDKQAQVDVLRCFKDYINHHPLEIDYQWVPSHQDEEKSCTSLTLREKVNVTVDELAKLGLISGMTDGDMINSEYPFEQIRVSTGGHKVTGSLKKASNSHWSHSTARELYHSKRIINMCHFDLTWWNGMKMAMKLFPKNV